MTFHLGWPQIVLIAMTILGLILTARDHGKPRTPTNFWTHITSITISYALLIWGGFFR